ncbi:NAD(P)-dependent oxidoreductase [Microvirga sp. VF16]|uniref:NAD-dependent epimerase/dehydratase family protein n=1 Tax=Microvirga sp. VF16 TaxID=2807101 RepID=UPI00193CA778|nr:NAD(P)-dependent oxidoreductase [Microvirga sp. VF16]QRM34012.1 NAD(P)-dependent oxidoreductase [Microvirga sp. VF16]
MAKLRVLLTGATGYIAGQLLPAFRERYDLRLIDTRQETRAGQAVEGVEVLDLLSASSADLQAIFTGVDVVVHSAYHRPDASDPQSQYDAECRNIDMMQRVYQTALDHDVRRVVAASTNQAAKWYEQPYFAGLRDRVSPEDYPRPDNFYGWAKAAYESLGFLYACGSLGRKLEVIQLRIVVPREIDASKFADLPRHRYVRELAGYISERDLQQLFCKSIETLQIDDEYGVPFHIFYGVSNNARTFWSIANARRVIGYQPQDDSETRFATDVARLMSR